jgi:hypothetical protein
LSYPCDVNPEHQKIEADVPPLLRPNQFLASKLWTCQTPYGNQRWLPVRSSLAFHLCSRINRHRQHAEHQYNADTGALNRVESRTLPNKILKFAGGRRGAKSYLCAGTSSPLWRMASRFVQMKTNRRRLPTVRIKWARNKHADAHWLLLKCDYTSTDTATK